MSPRPLAAIVVVLSGLVPSAAPARSEAVRPPVETVALAGPTLGIALAAADAEAVRDAVPIEVEGRWIARLEADWSAVEADSGRYDWAAVRAAVETLDRAGAAVVLALTGTHPAHVPGGGMPSPFVEGSVEAWVAFARSAVREMRGAALAFEIAPAGADAADPDALAYLIKNSSIGIRAQARASGVLAFVVQTPVGEDRLDVQQALWDADVAAYVDVVPVVSRSDSGTGAALTGFREAALAHPPAAATWAYLEGPGASRRSLAALAAGAAVAVLPRAADRDGVVADARFATGVQAALAESFAPAPPETVRVTDAAGAAVAGAGPIATYFSDTTFETLVVLDPGGAHDETAPISLIVPSAFVRNARVSDPAAGTTRRVAARPVDGDAGARSLSFGASGLGPVLVRFQSAAPPPEGLAAPEEEVEVERTRGLTAQEIIARYQEVQKRQDDRLERWTANAQVDFHFRFAQGGPTVDVTILSNYFWERGGELEWEQTDYFVNGNKVRWKNIPELPLIQPEKVVTLPLDLTLDRTYVYRLAGEDRVDGRDAYVLAFEPSDPDAAATLYRGRVWIDRETFVRLRANVIQAGLEAPVLSNEETDTYRAVTAADGSDFWMLSDIDGQQVWNAGGRSFVVRREVRFLSFDLNPDPAAFDAARSRAYASNHQMLRDTDEGFRYLERQDDGTRTVKTTVDTSQLFALGGVFRDNSVDGVVPLAGVNYFNYRLGGRDVQTNVFFAGALAFGTLTAPDLWGRKIDVTVDVGLSALKGDDKVFAAGEEVEALRIRDRTQRSALRIGVPLGSFVKMNLVGAVNFLEYDDSDEGEDARPDGIVFVLPEDHRETSVGAELLFNRKGWELEADVAALRRSSWKPWGLFDTVAGTFVDPEFEPTHQSFRTWSVSVRREWFLPKFQKIRAEVSALGGSDFDRFSEYRFGFFGDSRLFGFSGSGVRFDRGTIVRAGYLFNLFEVIRLQASVDTARVRSTRDLGETRAFTGVGVSANLVGPWKTVLNFDVGYALASDVPELEGEFEGLIVVLKLF